MTDLTPNRVLGKHADCPKDGNVIYRVLGRHGGERFCDGCGQSSHRGREPLAPETVDERASRRAQ